VKIFSKIYASIKLITPWSIATRILGALAKEQYSFIMLLLFFYIFSTPVTFKTLPKMALIFTVVLILDSLLRTLWRV